MRRAAILVIATVLLTIVGSAAIQTFVGLSPAQVLSWVITHTFLVAAWITLFLLYFING